MKPEEKEELSMDDYLTKPPNKKVQAEMLEKWLGQNTDASIRKQGGMHD